MIPLQRPIASMLLNNCYIAATKQHRNCLLAKDLLIEKNIFAMLFLWHDLTTEQNSTGERSTT